MYDIKRDPGSTYCQKLQHIGVDCGILDVSTYLSNQKQYHCPHSSLVYTMASSPVIHLTH